MNRVKSPGGRSSHSNPRSLCVSNNRVHFVENVSYLAICVTSSERNNYEKTSYKNVFGVLLSVRSQVRHTQFLLVLRSLGL